MKKIAALRGISMNKKLFLFLFLFSFSGWGWVQQTYDGTQSLHWNQTANGVTNIMISVSSEGYSKLPDDSERAAIISAINTWNSLYPKYSSFYFTVALTDTNDQNGFDYEHTIHFSSALGFSSTVAQTSTVFYLKTGDIVGADIALNSNYQFVTGDKATTSSQINLMDVLTHELGHFVGLDHTPLATSTMYFTAQNEQRFLSADELGFIKATYPPATSTDTWSVSGRVLLESPKRPVFGAHIIAIRVDEGPFLGTTEVGTFSNSHGYFTLSDLNPKGEYILAVFPIRNSSPYGSYYGRSDDEKIFKEKILTASDGSPLIFTKNSSNEASILVNTQNISENISFNNSHSQAYDLKDFSKKILIGTLTSAEKMDVFSFAAKEISLATTPKPCTSSK